MLTTTSCNSRRSSQELDSTKKEAELRFVSNYIFADVTYLAQNVASLSNYETSLLTLQSQRIVMIVIF